MEILNTYINNLKEKSCLYTNSEIQIDLLRKDKKTKTISCLTVYWGGIKHLDIIQPDYIQKPILRYAERIENNSIKAYILIGTDKFTKAELDKFIPDKKKVKEEN